MCAAGTYSSGAAVSACVTCDAGTFSTALGATTRSDCAACPKGTYQSGSACVSCPDYSTTLDKGSTSRLQCVCQSGFTSTITESGGGCSGCPINTYQGANGQCITCPAGTVTDQVASPSVASCRALPGYFAKYTKSVHAVIEVPADQFFNNATFASVVQQAVGGGKDTKVNVNDVK